MSITKAKYLTASWLIAVVVCLSFGCTSFLSDAMVKAPNHGVKMQESSDPGPLTLQLLGVDEQFRVDVGPPSASLSVWVIEPTMDDDQTTASPRGTILVLHGIRNERFWMLGAAKRFADAGYRAVLVGLRGHGRSSGDYLTFGVVEKIDLAQVIDELEARDLIAGRLGAYGVSYGAATAIQLAGFDDRIDAVVSIASFSDLRTEAPHYMRTFLPIVGCAIDDQTHQRIIDIAGEKAGFDPDQASPVDWISRTRAPVLLMHGQSDWIIPPQQSQQLLENANEQSELAPAANLGHITIWLDPDGRITRRAVAWFDRWL